MGLFPKVNTKAIGVWGIMPVVGLEPTTLDLKGRYSTTELHEHGHSISWAVKRKDRAMGIGAARF